jgi:hypothetical protein
VGHVGHTSQQIVARIRLCSGDERTQSSGILFEEFTHCDPYFVQALHVASDHDAEEAAGGVFNVIFRIQLTGDDCAVGKELRIHRYDVAAIRLEECLVLSGFDLDADDAEIATGVGDGLAPGLAASVSMHGLSGRAVASPSREMK